jgi:glyoxylase-like metal-dependent hydrolase (beta-lactamase superfamily II)
MRKSKRNIIAALALVAFGAVGVALTGGPEDVSGSMQPLIAGDKTKETYARFSGVETLDVAAEFEGATQGKERPFNAHIAFLETALSYGNNRDPRVTFLAVNAYINTNGQLQGIAFFEALLAHYGAAMNPEVRAQYLAGYALLRATYAAEVPLISRIGWVLDTFSILDEAQQLSGGADALVRWARGLIYAQVPFFFQKKVAAYEELLWLVDHPELEPTPGFYRAVYANLAGLYENDGDLAKAEAYRKQAGYEKYDPEALYMGWFTSGAAAGTAMSEKKTLIEVVPGRVFALHGFGFSEMYFVRTIDGSQLVAIDAGTRPDLTKAAYEFLMQQVPNLPPVSSLIATHAHWDHVGGYSYFRGINPELKIYARGNHRHLLGRVTRQHSYTYFRGASFRNDWVEDFRPDVVASESTVIQIGGSNFELLPVDGGETEDALFVFVPEVSSLFVGDFMMPYYGEPWVDEGNLDGAFAAMQEVANRQPKYVLHGHRPLSILYPIAEIAGYAPHFKWLVSAARSLVAKGYSAKEIIRMNLIPPGLTKTPNLFLAYLDPRDHIIARVADQMVGIWHEERTGDAPEGLDIIVAEDFGRLLGVHLKLDASDIAGLVHDLIDGGDNELALKMAVAGLRRYPNHSDIIAAKVRAADRLRALSQYLDPFKFTVYSEIAGDEIAPLADQK